MKRYFSAFAVLLLLVVAGCNTPPQVDTIAQTKGEVQIDVSGGVSFSVDDSGRSVFEHYQCSDGELWQLRLLQGSDKGVMVIFYDDRPSSNTYNVTWTGAFEGVNVLVSDNSGGEIRAFSGDPTGTITLEENDGIYTGQLNFTATGNTFSDPDTMLEVQVNGSFSGLPMRTIEMEKCFSL